MVWLKPYADVSVQLKSSPLNPGNCHEAVVRGARGEGFKKFWGQGRLSRAKLARIHATEIPIRKGRKDLELLTA